MIRDWIRNQIGIPWIRHYARTIEDSAYRPKHYQQHALQKIITSLHATEISQKSGLHAVKTMDDMRKINSVNYEMLRPEFEKIYQQGKPGYFSWQKIDAISLTSGTTGGPKYIPITKNLVNNFKRIGPSLYAGYSYTLQNPSDLFAGKSLYLSALPHIDNSPTALPVGFISGYMNTKRAWLYKDLVYPTPATAAIADAQTRLTRLFEEIRHQDIRVILGFPAIIHLITEKALAYFNVDYLQQLWKNLSVCVYGGNFLSASQNESLRRSWFGEQNRDKKLTFLEHYSAVEGFFGHTFRVDWPGLVFNAFDVFYQFKRHRDEPSFLQLHELKADERYLIYVTTMAGLVNYEMEDILHITSTNPLTFCFLARAKEQISLISEKILVCEIQQTVEALAQATQQPIRDFAAYLDCSQGNTLCFVVSSPIKDAAEAIQLLDKTLRRINPNYNEYRNNNTYREPKLIYKSPSYFNRYRELNIHKGNFKEKRLFMSEADFLLEYTAHS